MKNKITKNTAMKTISSLILLIILTLPFKLFSQVQNVPNGLFTLGPIVDPIEMGPDFQWTFINETDCDITLAHWQVFDSTSINVKNGILVPNNGTVTINQSDYLSLFGVANGTFLTHTYFQVSVGAGYEKEMSPFVGGKVLTSMPYPCDCFIWVANFSTKTYKMKKCQ